MALYSSDLGHISTTDLGVNHLLYTVPPAAGPAVIRHLSAFTNATGAIIVSLIWPDSQITYLCNVDNTAGTQGLAQAIALYQVIPPGTKIQAQQWAHSVFWNCSLGGYQFSTP